MSETWRDSQGNLWTRSKDSGIPITVTQEDDPAHILLTDGHTTTPSVYRKGCYICEDPEFAQMGLPLCRPCPNCSTIAGEPAGHIAADDCVCDDCDYDQEEAYLAEQAAKEGPARGDDPDHIFTDAEGNDR